MDNTDRGMARFSDTAYVNSRRSAQGLLLRVAWGWSKANLAWLIQIGKGDRAVTEARFRRRNCGELVKKRVRPPVPAPGTASVVARVGTDETACFIMTYDAAMSNARTFAASRNSHG